MDANYEAFIIRSQREARQFNRCYGLFWFGFLAGCAFASILWLLFDLITI